MLGEKLTGPVGPTSELSSARVSVGSLVSGVIVMPLTFAGTGAVADVIDTEADGVACATAGSATPAAASTPATPATALTLVPVPKIADKGPPPFAIVTLCESSGDSPAEAQQLRKQEKRT